MMGGRIFKTQLQLKSWNKKKDSAVLFNINFLATLCKHTFTYNHESTMSIDLRITKKFKQIGEFTSTELTIMIWIIYQTNFVQEFDLGTNNEN